VDAQPDAGAIAMNRAVSISMSDGILPIQRVGAPGRSTFESRYLRPPGRPVILTDIVTKWPAFGKWTFGFLSDAFGDRPVVAKDQLFTPKKAFHMTFRTFLRFCENPVLLEKRVSGSPLYFGFQPFSRESGLLKDFAWPEECDNLYAHMGDGVYDWYLRHFGVLLVGPAGTVTPTHVDLFGTHAWLAQLCGSKRFVFEAPSLDERAPNAGASCMYEAIVHAGDMIVFPQGWKHSVTSLAPSISLSFNFVNHTNIAAHLLEIFRDLPAWTNRVDTPELRKALNITWTNGFRASSPGKND
jgi:Cupin-like domain